MKLTRLFFALIFLFSTISCFAQDYRLNLGKAYFRFDSDSNKIRIGGPSIPRLATEFDARLFDFNLEQFYWDKAKGLCLRDLAKYDSTKTRKIIVYADTGDGEIIPYQIRSYTIYKPHYANIPDLFDLHVRFESSDNGSKSQDFNLINNVYNLFENLNRINITRKEYIVPLSPFSRPGNYYITISYEVEFEVNDPDINEVNTLINYDSNLIRNLHHIYYYSINNNSILNIYIIYVNLFCNDLSIEIDKVKVHLFHHLVFLLLASLYLQSFYLQQHLF